MAYPDEPTIDYSYTAFQQAQGDDSFPGTQLDNDLLNLRTSIVDIIEFLRVSLRSDGALNNGSVTSDSLTPGLRAMLGGEAVIAEYEALLAEMAAIAASIVSTIRVCTGDLTIYYGGDDAEDIDEVGHGLTAETAFTTKYTAARHVGRHYDMAGYNLTIQQVDDTVVETTVVESMPNIRGALNGGILQLEATSCRVRGNIIDPSRTIVRGIDVLAIRAAHIHTIWDFGYLQTETTGAAADCWDVTDARIKLRGIIFGETSFGHVFTQSSTFRVEGDCTITHGGAYLFRAENAMFRLVATIGITMNIPADIDFTFGSCYSPWGARFYVGCVWNVTGSVTGPRASLHKDAILFPTIDESLEYLPGDEPVILRDDARYGDYSESTMRQTISDDIDITLNPLTSPRSTYITGVHAADRSVTLLTAGANVGDRFEIIRTSSGAFKRNVGTGPLNALDENERCTVEFSPALAWESIAASVVSVS